MLAGFDNHVLFVADCEPTTQWVVLVCLGHAIVSSSPPFYSTLIFFTHYGTQGYYLTFANTPNNTRMNAATMTEDSLLIFPNLFDYVVSNDLTHVAYYGTHGGKEIHGRTTPRKLQLMF